MKFTEFISIIVIILAIVLTFKNSCGIGKMFETFTSNAPKASNDHMVDLVLGELYPDFPKIEDPIILTASGEKDGISGERVGISGEAFTNMEPFVGERCTEPSTERYKGIDGKWEPYSWSSGRCSDTVTNIDSCGNYTDRLCGGKNKNYNGFDTSCPKKYVVPINGNIELHPVYDIDVCNKNVNCIDIGEDAIRKIMEKYNSSVKLEIYESEAKAIGKQILHCYIAIKENRKNTGGSTGIKGYTDEFIEEIKKDTKNLIENLINLTQFYDNGGGRSGGSGSGGRGGSFSPHNNNDMPNFSEDDLRHFIARKRKIKGVCQYLRNSSMAGADAPRLYTNGRTTNQFGNICTKTGYDGYPQYTGLYNGGSYPNAGGINIGGINADKSGKYPTVLRSDPKPYNGIMSLF